MQAALAASLATLSLTHSASTESTWNLDVLLSGMAPEMAKLSPERIAEQLDHDSFALPDARAFLLLMSLWRRATGEKAFPLPTAIQRVWKNAPGQIAFLRFASAAPPEMFSFEGAARKLPPLEGLQVRLSSVYFSPSQCLRRTAKALVAINVSHQFLRGSNSHLFSPSVLGADGVQQGFEHVRDVGHLDTWLLHKSWSTHGGFSLCLALQAGEYIHGRSAPLQ